MARGQSKLHGAWPLGVAIAVLFAVSIIGYMKLPSQAEQDQNAAIEPEGTELSEKRTKAPDVEFFNQEQKATKLSEFKGKVVLFSFWASWCAPCLMELPTFSTLQKKYADKNFEVVAVNVDDVKEDAAKFIQEFWPLKKLNFTSWFDPEKKAAKAFNVEVLPSNFVIDRKGQIAMTGLGIDDWQSQEIIESLENLLAEK